MSLKKQLFSFYLPAIIAVFLTIGMVFYPKEAFEASLSGLAIWWNIVFPALLPFFIFSQLLIGLGVVHFLGVLLEPIMRPIFNVPGAGSFVMAMGLASGYPIGAVLTKKLREQNLCNKVEAERLLSFTNTADPLFMFGAVAVGMLHAPHAGMIIAFAHYASSLSVGLLMRFYRARGEIRQKEKTRPNREAGIISRAMAALVGARQKDNRPFGEMLGEAVIQSINTLLLVGGFIMLFSVILTMMDLSGIFSIIASPVSKMLNFIRISPSLSSALIRGIFELDLGCQAAGSLQGVAMDEKLIIVSAIIAWSGLSVFAQVASIISSTDISIFPYLLARILHAILAGLYTALLLGPLKIFQATEIIYQQVFLQTIPRGNLPYWYSRTVFMGGRLIIILLIMAVLSLLIYYSERAKANKKRFKHF
ncbi:MAG: sporulation integral membrane protein YlbJ [Firmicutes bacterium]|nr:sporulation integral membrane protein YlbJ [Bacillota bacterium]